MAEAYFVCHIGPIFQIFFYLCLHRVSLYSPYYWRDLFFLGFFIKRPHILDFDKFNGVSLNHSSLAQTFLLGWIYVGLTFLVVWLGGTVIRWCSGIKVPLSLLFLLWWLEELCFKLYLDLNPCWCDEYWCCWLKLLLEYCILSINGPLFTKKKQGCIFHLQNTTKE